MLAIAAALLTSRLSSAPVSGPAAPPCSGRIGLPAGTVGDPGGHMRDRDSVYVLDGSEHPTVLIVPPCGAARRITLASAGTVPFGGIARASDGSLCLLTSDARGIECFDERSGRRTRRDDLGIRIQAIWTIGQRLAYAPFEPNLGLPLIFREQSKGFSPDRTFVSRGAPADAELPLRAPGPDAAAMVGNLVQCGLGSPEAVPCWRMLTGEMRLVGDASETHDLPAFSIPGRSRSFPVRDVLRTENGILWLLLNDPGRTREEPVGPGTRILRYQAGRVRVESLPGPARAILDGDDGRILVLFRDGSASWRGEAVR